MKRSTVKVSIILITAVLLLLPACKTYDRGPLSKSGLYFDTVVSVDIYGCTGDGEAILEECMNMCSHYQSLFDKDIPESDVAKINSNGPGTINVDRDTAQLISDALYYSGISNGKFDITINPVSALWDFHEGSEKIPGQKDIDEALSHVGHNNIEADTAGSTVTVKAGGVSIDVGGVAKGYIADRIAAYLKTCPISGAIINMGGDIRLIGSKPDGTAFNIGINDPNDPGNCAASLYVTDTAVATSGIYERAFTKGGRQYHHILDVATGYPVDTDVLSVTVITDSAASSDCLCTVSIILGSDKALKLIEKTDDTEAVFILTDGTMLTSSGADKYIRK